MFSVVITTKDRVQFLRRAISSISMASVVPTDIVIINDGGIAISESMFESENVSFTIINHELSKGANYCRNLGIDLAKEELVFLLDDDDAVTFDSFKTRLKAFDDEDVGISYTGIKIVLDSNLSQVKRQSIPKPINSYYPEILKCGNLIGSTSRVALRKRWFYEAGMFDESLPCFQDYDLWIRMTKICKVSTDLDAGIYYTIHEKGQQISSNYEKYLLTSDYLLNKYRSELLSSSSLNAFRSHLYLRVAIAGCGNNSFIKLKFSLLSFFYKPSFRSLALFLLPTSLLKRFFNFV